ncbi:DUF1565 domain-containing protein [Autumnicola musiva]|uniref:DUF1565 domain-containing protein n=1 Tax=Autumnicola musiva TaxID=3075589 RepID=A0ABU3D822_9FLAO|nr:DUF1565 domain-containing protein [Zunongwangia sp. F117]MDT0677685.1 DUF1565 domain-containing protein [Zunongwangia sp. F117]
MKQFFFLFLIFLSSNIYSQTPEKMSYQAIVRNSTDELLVNKDVNLIILIRQGSPRGTILYSEKHNTSTNRNGLVSLQIGTGLPEIGRFSNIDWSQGPYFVENQVDILNNGNFSITGISQMLSVPYALHAKSADAFNGVISAAQIHDLPNYLDNGIDGNETMFKDWDKNYADDFSGKYEDLIGIPKIYTSMEVDSLLLSVQGGEGVVQSLQLENEKLTISGGNSVTFANWDTDVEDDFSGNYDDLENKPEMFNGNYEDLQNQPVLFSGNYEDLHNLPQIYTSAEVDSLLLSVEGGEGFAQSLNLENKDLTISGGNSVSFENWDTNAEDDFSGSYRDLSDIPNFYTAAQVDSLLLSVESGEGIVQSLHLENKELTISGGNSVSFENWDINVEDDFSGNFEDLHNLPQIYTSAEVDSLLFSVEGVEGIVQSLNLENKELSISGGNSVSFENWDTNAEDDFSGSYRDLSDIPNFYTAAKVDSLLLSVEGGEGITQSLHLENKELSISGGNFVSFENWDTNAEDDFSGSYDDLEDKPEFFSGNFEDLQNKPALFSGNFEDLINLPQLYTSAEVDSLLFSVEGGEGIAQSLHLENKELTISGGNSVSFENWDTNAEDDFSGSYDDLEDKPEFFSGNFEDLQNKPALFSGNFEDLINLPPLYTSAEVDSLLLSVEGGEGIAQSLHLENKELTISGGNSVSFENWDTNAEDDFSGNYGDLQNKPNLFSGQFNDLTNIPHLYTAEEVDDLLANLKNNASAPQELSLDKNQLSISQGNNVSFESWDTNAEDDFDGKYSSLLDAPSIYTKSEVDNLLSNKPESDKDNQFLTLNEDQLTISNGNTVAFDEWDRDVTDDFSGDYNDLRNKPEFYMSTTIVDSIKEVSNKIEITNEDAGVLFISNSPTNDTVVIPNKLKFEGQVVRFEAQNSGDIVLDAAKIILYDLNRNEVKDPHLRKGAIRQISDNAWILEGNQISIISQDTQFIDVTTDLVALIDAKKNAVGNGIEDDAPALQSAIYAGAQFKKTIYLPAGKYKINSQIQLSSSGLHIKGAGMDKTFIIYDSSYKGSGALFQSNGKSDITFEDLSISGNKKEVEAAVQINSYPNNNKRIGFERVRIFNFWGHGIMLGHGNDKSWSNDEVIIQNCKLYNIGSPSSPISFTDHDTSRFNAIHLQQDTRKLLITGNTIYNCSGDGIFGWGWSDTSDNFPAESHGDWIITGNNITRCWMGIEINGNGLPQKISIQNNIIKYPTRNYGYCLSIDSQFGHISNNTLVTNDRCAIEGTINQGSISNNIINISAFKDGGNGLAPNAKPSSSNRIAAMELYGFAVKVTGNNITLERKNPNSFTPAEFNGIKIISTTTDPSSQPTSFDGIDGNPGYWHISDNYIHGFTHKAVDATNSKIYKVYIRGNTFTSRNAVESPIQIYGYDWVVKGNIFDLTASIPKDRFHGAVRVFAGQSNNTRSIVSENTIINDVWQFLNTDKFIAFKNDFVMNNGLAYTSYPYPAMTEAQKGSIEKLHEGMMIYQKDGTKGIYLYNGQSWILQQNLLPQ